MADKKNQHFVPKVYLKTFAPDEAGASINIWLHEYNKIVTGASIKNQCSKSYFYGLDLVLENLFRYPEGLYGKIKNKLLSGQTLSDSDLYVLLFFWLIQHTRAERYLMSHVAAMATLQTKAMLGHENNNDAQDYFGPSMTEKEAAMISLTNATKFIDIISDLKRVILVNRSNTPFITSDNPAVFSNKLIIQRYKGLKNWGLKTAGLYLFLPISSTYAFLAYDSNIYWLVDRKDSVCAINNKDAHALNQLIFVNSDNCIFFKYKEGFPEIQRHLEDARSLKPEALYTVNIAIPDEQYYSETHRKFKVVSEDEFKESNEGLVHLESRPPQIKNHLPRLRYKDRPR